MKTKYSVNEELTILPAITLSTTEKNHHVRKSQDSKMLTFLAFLFEMNGNLPSRCQTLGTNPVLLSVTIANMQ